MPELGVSSGSFKFYYLPIDLDNYIKIKLLKNYFIFDIFYALTFISQACSIKKIITL